VERQLPAGPQMNQRSEFVAVSRSCLSYGEDEQLRESALQFASKRPRLEATLDADLRWRLP
jgi:hypothetical protein